MSGRAVLVCVGDELLSGRISDTNSSFIRDRLAPLGWGVAAVMTVGDSIPDISSVLRCALQLGELVIVTGGLGPTSDDITREATADALGRGLVTEESIVQRLRERFAHMGFEMPESNLRQAQVLEGTTSIIEGKGTAPGLEIDDAGRRIILLPGVPAEMHDMMDRRVIPDLRSAAAGTERAGRIVKLFGQTEALVGETVDSFLPEDGSVQAAYLVNSGLIEVHLKTEGEDREPLETLLDGVVARIRERMGPSVVTEDDRDLPTVAGELLKRRGLTLSAAESCTGGMLGEFITQVPGSSAWFKGGVVSYAVPVKESVLGVAHDLIEREGVVSEAVAAAMARGARKLLASDLALGITGIAGPEGGSEEVPVGTVCLGLAAPEGEFTRRVRLPGDRELIRRIASNAALFMLATYLSGGGLG
jgi:nicotinamide-nucleotide amidase